MSQEELEERRMELIGKIETLLALPPLDVLEEELDEIEWLLGGPD